MFLPFCISIINTVWGAPLVWKHSNRLQFSGVHDNGKLHLIKSTTRGVKCLTSPTYTCIYSCQLMNLFSLETSYHSSPPRGGEGVFGLFLRTIDPIRNRNLRSQAPKGGKRGGDSGWMEKRNTQFSIILTLYSVTEDLSPPLRQSNPSTPPPLPSPPVVNKDWS